MSLFAELKRRKVFRVAVVYAATAFVLLQASDLLAAGLGLPDWFFPVVTVLLLLGFPVALVLAWALELTPDGIKVAPRRDREAVNEPLPSLLGKRTVFATALLVVLGIGIGAGWFLKPPIPAPDTLVSTLDEEAAAADPVASIAVLPFTDLSPEGDQAYFSDGIAEEILNALAGVEGLEVASRTSSFVFRGERKSIPVIAGELGVDHVLEGSVRKAGDQVRITAQLIAAEGDVHLWSETYDRELSVENLFAIQDGIATSIVDELQASLGIAVTGEVRAARVTDNLDAYELFLQAREPMHTIELAERRVEVLEQAVALDPEFVDAWAELAWALTLLPAWRHDLKTVPYQERAIEAAERVLELDASRRTAFEALRHAYYFLNDWLEADAVIERARTRWPDFGYGAGELLGLGYLERASEEARREMEVQPDSPFPRLMHGVYLAAVGRYEEAISELEASMLAGLHGGQEWVIAETHWHLGRTDSWTVVFGTFFREQDPELLPLLPHMKELLLAGPDQQEAATLRFRAIAREMGFEIADLIAPGPQWGPRLPVLVVVRLGHADVVADGFWSNMPKFWMWTPAYRSFRQSDAFRARVHDSGLLAYWQANGWPDLCRPVGRDDFECD